MPVKPMYTMDEPPLWTTSKPLNADRLAAIRAEPIVAVASDSERITLFKGLKFRDCGLEHIHAQDIPPLIKFYNQTFAESFERHVHVMKRLKAERYDTASNRYYISLKTRLLRVRERQFRALAAQLLQPVAKLPAVPVIDDTSALRPVPGFPSVFADLRDGQLYLIKKIKRQRHGLNPVRWRVVIPDATGKKKAVLCARAVLGAHTGCMPTREVDHIDGKALNDAPNNLREVDRETNEENKQ